MLKKLLLALVLFVGGFAAFVATRPATFRVERSATIKAPAEVVYAQVNDFHAWAAWSPWEKLDPAMKRTYSGEVSGVGAAYAWVGIDEVGEGTMAIIAARPSDEIVIRLEFLKPWKAVNTTTFSFKQSGDATTVTWAIDGENDFMGKAMSVFMNMDRRVGGYFERGLAAMSTVAEAAATLKAEEAAKAAAAAKIAADAAVDAHPPKVPPPVDPAAPATK